MDPLEQQFRAAVDAGDTDTIERLGHLVDQSDQATRTRLSQRGALLNAALHYIRRGWSVFPCVPNEKRPATRHGLHDATTDEEQVRAWWDDNPMFNIGLPTGHTFDVIDIDGSTGWASLIGWLRDPDNDLPECIGYALTPRRPGAHRYVGPSGEGNKAGLLPGIDYRGAGGYVCAAPSRTEAGMYVWTTPIPQGVA